MKKGQAFDIFSSFKNCEIKTKRLVVKKDILKRLKKDYSSINDLVNE